VKTLCFSLVALLIVFVVLKPISRQVTATLSQTPALALPSGGPADARRTAFGVGADSAYSGLSSGAPQDDPQAVFRHISEQIRKEPVQSARLLESWINTGAEEAN
jgi:flagellar biosynthesis/type III secretory pathway M-ring protein FliF/YscJ